MQLSRYERSHNIYGMITITLTSGASNIFGLRPSMYLGT